MEETVEYARKLAERIGKELNIPVYCYESAAFVPERRNLATCRAGEYEALGERLSSEQWHPDFGPRELNSWTAKTGATAVGARNFLVAYNVNPVSYTHLSVFLSERHTLSCRYRSGRYDCDFRIFQYFPGR